MSGLENTLTAILSDIGVSQEKVSAAERLRAAGKCDDLQKYLRMCRCDLIEEMHSTQKKVDNLDYLLRQIKGGALS